VWLTVYRRVAGLRIASFAIFYVVVATVCCVLAATGKAKFTDLHVYRLGGEAALHGVNLYSLRYYGLPFSYPPFSGVIFAGVAPLPWAVAAALVTVASGLVLPVMLYLALRLPPLPSWLDQKNAWRLALAAAAAAIWLEPVRTTLGYGQIDLFLAVGILYDLTRPDAARVKGVSIGLAAGIKLIPAIFVIYLLFTRRFRAALTAAVAFMVTVAVGFVVMPASSAHFWNGTFLNPGRISPVQNPENQSLSGALARTLHTVNPGHIWLPLAVIVALIGLALATYAQRHGDEAAGFSLCAITGLLVSPISWTHHWVIAVPAVLIASFVIYRNKAGKPAARSLSIVALVGLLIIGWVRLARDTPGSQWLHLPMLSPVDSDIYVIAGLAALLFMCFGLIGEFSAAKPSARIHSDVKAAKREPHNPERPPPVAGT
jgi:alpha-1,2-mannosyltransferase